MKTPKINYVCTFCGSDEVKFDAEAEWDAQNQAMVILNTGVNAFCMNCGGECSTKEVPA